MSEVSHLHESARELLGQSEEARLRAIDSERWIGYPLVQQVLGKMERLLTYPPRHRMPNLLIVGETNNGKTMLLRRFCNAHPSDDNPEGDAIRVPVLYVEAPPVPDEGRFYASILDSLYAPYKPHDSTGRKETLALKQMRNVGTRILIVDEIHHILAGSLNKQRAFLNVIKRVGNILQIPIIGAGTIDAFRAIQTDPQLSNRFEPILLPLWQDDIEFKRLLVSFESLLPLQHPSKLHGNNIATRLHAMCCGNIGELSQLLSKAAIYAIKSGSEKIDAETLDAIGWVSPTDRKQLIHRAR